MTPYSRQLISEEDIDEVVAVLRSDLITQGPKVAQFEQAIVAECGSNYALATINGSTALHLACLALGVSAGDLVWVSAVSFVASANCARYCGAVVDFIDINPNDGLLCIESLSSKLQYASKHGKLPKVLIVVHLAGQSCAMKEIAQLCRKYGIAIIEDAAHALGSSYLGRPVGSCEYSDICVFSFHPVKPITSAEGGMLTMNNQQLFQSAKLYANHGIERNSDLFELEVEGDWHYEQQALGYNYRMSDLHAALGWSQLKRLHQWRKARKKWVEYYRSALSESNISPLFAHDHGESTHHLFVILTKDNALRNELFRQLRGAGFSVNLHYIPIFLHPYYRLQGYDIADFQGAMNYYRHALSLPLFADMDQAVADRVLELSLAIAG